MSASTVTVDRKGSVCIITMCRPETFNTLSLELAMDLLAAALTCARDPHTRAVVLTGMGKSFCFGGDLKAMSSKGGENVGPLMREVVSYMNSAISQFMRMDAPVIAAVNGTAAGAGVGFAMMADLIVAGESTKFNLAYTGVGLTPDAGVTYLLPRTIGMKRTMEMLLLNPSLSAQQALEWGLVNRVVPDEDLLSEALKIAERLASGPLHAFGKSKRLVAQAMGALETQLAVEGETIALQAGTSEAQEGIAAFLGKRKPNYSG
jgi:2-(1,2-epoxy-1,2-dihydrophenyl)acetyl-CoA isomerase